MGESLQDLQAKRASLRKQLEEVEEAIRSFGDATPVEVGTHKNLRNTPCVSTDYSAPDGYMIVFADKEMTKPADKADHGGWVSKHAWAQFQKDHPDCMDLIWSH
jgi:hypothetical protein